jgi:hypothetical protein
MGNIDLKVISTTENSNKFQKTRFWNEKLVENMVTLEGLPFNSSMISFHIWLFKKSIHTLQNNVRMLSFPILYWVDTWANDMSHTNLLYEWNFETTNELFKNCTRKLTIPSTYTIDNMEVLPSFEPSLDYKVISHYHCHPKSK